MDINIKLFRNLYNFKLFYRTISVMDFLPFVGPVKNASEALMANCEHDTKLARDKGITALVTGAIDLLGLSLAICSIAYSCEKFTTIASFALLKHAMILAILVTVVAFVSGTKIVINQLVKLSIDNMVGVNTASAAMVNTVSITATGIESVVETINQITWNMVLAVRSSYSSAKAIALAPIVCVKVCIRSLSDCKRFFDRLLVHTFVTYFRIYCNIFMTFIQINITIALVSVSLFLKAVHLIRIKYFN